MDKKTIHMVTWVLAMVGALNWLLVGVNGTNLVGDLLGTWPMVLQVVYVLVGLSAIYEIVIHMGSCKLCSGMK